MAVDRRNFLKLVTYAGLSTFFIREQGRLFAQPGPGTQTYVLLHGMFFLEYSGNVLVVATHDHKPAPPFHRHEYRVHVHNGQLAAMPDFDDSFLNSCLPGTIDCFPPELPQFSRQVIGQTTPFLLKAPDFRCKLVLPLPKNILRLRQADAQYFCPDTSTTVGGALKIASLISTLLCLVYDPAPGASATTTSYYAQHANTPTTAEINEALKSAKRLCGQSFDLTMKDCMPFTACIDNNQSLPAGMDGTDEYDLSEFGTPPCVSAPVPMQAPFQCPHLSAGAAARSTPAQTRKGVVEIHGADVSSCPQFGIIP